MFVTEVKFLDLQKRNEKKEASERKYYEAKKFVSGD